MDLGEARRLAVDCVQEAGALLLAGAQATPAARQKGGSGDLVTDLDLASERLIVGRLLTAYPEHAVIAEESGPLGAAGSEWTWLVDPLDGTNNLAIGLPAYVVGLALCHRGTPVLGVVHEPLAARTWSALRDRGAVEQRARLAPVRLSPAARPWPHGPVLAWTQGYGVARDDARLRALKSLLDLRARRLLQLWAPLLAWAMLARGDIDGFVGYRAEAVDLPAGALLAREAGLTVRALDGGPFDERPDAPVAARSFVAAHPQALPGLLELLLDDGREGEKALS